MVRLKVENAGLAVDKAAFQFLYGAIKSSSTHLVTKKKAYFNSCMVRLKAAKTATKKSLFLRLCKNKKSILGSKKSSNSNHTIYSVIRRPVSDLVSNMILPYVKELSFL